MPSKEVVPGDYFSSAFEIEKKLGAGYFGVVYQVKSKEDGKLYAVIYKALIS